LEIKEVHQIWKILSFGDQASWGAFGNQCKKLNHLLSKNTQAQAGPNVKH
jgi:hypothetical protein